MEELEPKDPALTKTIKSMNDRGIKTMYGRWLIDGAPRVLLFDTGTGYGFLDEWKGDLWSVAGIPSPPGDHETNEAIVFGYIIAWFLGEVKSSNLPFGGTTNIICLVRLPREETGSHCPIPRVACWCCSTSLQEAPDRCYYHLHHTRYPSWSLPLRWLGRLLQQPAILRCGR